MYYINSSGKDVSFSFKAKKYDILAWSQVDLPEELYEYIGSHPQDIPLEVDYHRYIAEMEKEQEILGYYGSACDAFILAAIK